ncbi:MAG: universal stress protein [Thermoplasmata archaeon]|nr:universal stress protein [Thermoplasmata archaeon]
MLDRILVGYDGTPRSEAAAIYAAKLFPRARFHIVTVVDTRRAGVYYTKMIWKIMERSSREAAEKLERKLERMGVKTRVAILKGRPPRELLRYARDHDISTIVLSTYTKEGIQTLYLGSTAEEILAISHQKQILIVNKAVDDPQIKRVLLATDGTKYSKRAENGALLLASHFGAKLTALYVHPLREEVEKKKRDMEENIKWKAKHMGVDVKVKVLHGTPEELILKEVKRYDIVVLGSGGRGFYHWLVRRRIGHLAREVVATSEKPVFLFN